MKNILDLPEYEMILVDAVNLAARSYHGLKQLSWEGRPTGMMYGVMKFVLTAQQRHPGARIIFLWEGVDSKRKSLHTFYKSNRDRKDDSFRSCLEETRDYLKDTGVTSMFHLGLEADDLAGHICSIADEHQRILLVTTDEDWFQYMRKDRIDLQRRDNIETFDDIHASLGFPPSKMGMWKILKGDRTDDIPGIKGFPSSVARLLVNKCDHYSEFKTYPITKHNPKWERWEREIHRQWDTVIERNAELVLFHPEWIEETQIVDQPGERNEEALIKVFESYGMKSLVSMLRSSNERVH